MTGAETRALVLDCDGDAMLGVFHPGGARARSGVVIVVGGPQYRIGSHRQFLLLARALQGAGIPTLRFDYRGMGDSDGEARDFESIDRDIAAAIDGFMAAAPGLEQVVLWGLCDAASAILFYAHGDPRVAGIALMNPWVRTDEGLARTHLRHHYLTRLADSAFWRRVISGKVNPFRAMGGLVATVGRLGAREPGRGGGGGAPLPDRMAQGFQAFGGPVLLLISGQDLTAREFEDTVRGAAGWHGIDDPVRVTRHDLADADHTFSRGAWRDAVARWTINWMGRNFA